MPCLSLTIVTLLYAAFAMVAVLLVSVGLSTTQPKPKSRFTPSPKRGQNIHVTLCSGEKLVLMVHHTYKDSRFWVLKLRSPQSKNGPGSSGLTSSHVAGA